jgi:hypothetical protein
MISRALEFGPIVTEDKTKQKAQTDAKADEKVVGTKTAKGSENAANKAMGK